MRCFDDIELVEKAMWTRSAVKMLWGNLKNVPSPREQICMWLGHNRIWNQSRAVDILCNRVRGLTRILTGKNISSFDLWELQIIISGNSETVWIVMGRPLYFQTKILDSKRLRPKVKEQHQTLVQMFWHAFQKIVKTISTKNLNHQHLHALHNGIPRPHEVSPPISSFEATAVIVLRIHGRLRLEKPLDHGIAASASCQVQRCFASGAAAPRPSHRQKPKQNEGEKNLWEKFWAPQKSKFWKLWPLKNPPWT